jgi:hypothetical protein
MLSPVSHCLQTLFGKGKKHQTKEKDEEECSVEFQVNLNVELQSEPQHATSTAN